MLVCFQTLSVKACRKSHIFCPFERQGEDFSLYMNYEHLHFSRWYPDSRLSPQPPVTSVALIVSTQVKKSVKKRYGHPGVKDMNNVLKCSHRQGDIAHPLQMLLLGWTRQMAAPAYYVQHLLLFWTARGADPLTQQLTMSLHHQPNLSAPFSQLVFSI